MTERVYDCDLHAHTNRSDGADSYEQIIQAAVVRGLKVLAITDHDIRPKRYMDVAGCSVSLQEYGRTHGLLVIPGIEFSCNTEVEDVHIVGLDCDFSHPGFGEQEERTRQSKIEGYQELCMRLTNLGMPISLAEVAAAQPQGFTMDAIQKKHIFEMMARKGYAPDWSSAKLLVKQDTRLQVKRHKPEAEDMIRLIKDSGGIAVLAHPYLIEEELLTEFGKISRQAYMDRLVTAGIDGIEGAYTYDKTSYSGHLRPEEIEQQIRDGYMDRVKFISGGSDYHNDMAKGVKKERCRCLGDKGISFADFKASPLGYLAE